MKDNFEGGATWAYEVGSQSMVCPIIVEDLDPPRQMLVEVVTDILSILGFYACGSKELIIFFFVVSYSYRCFVKNGVSS